MSLLKLVPNFLKSAFNIVDKFVPDKDLAQKIKAEIAERGDELEGKALEAQKAIIVAEAQSGTWLAQNWRPVTMLTFVGLITAHWLGFTSENIGDQEVLSLLEIVKVGLGGYVIGRSAEKSIKYWKST